MQYTSILTALLPAVAFAMPQVNSNQNIPEQIGFAITDTIAGENYPDTQRISFTATDIQLQFSYNCSTSWTTGNQPTNDIPCTLVTDTDFAVETVFFNTYVTGVEDPVWSPTDFKLTVVAERETSYKASEWRGVYAEDVSDDPTGHGCTELFVRAEPFYYCSYAEKDIVLYLQH